MDTNQLQQLATNARLNHWPPHLGVVTEAEKVEYLANALNEAVLRDAEIDALKSEAEKLDDEISYLENKLDACDDEIERLKTKVDDMTEENQRLRDELAGKPEEPNV